MSEIENTTEHPELPELDPKHVKKMEAAAPDRVLGVLSNVAGAVEGFGLGITLNIGGVIVAGDLIGRTEWFRTLIEENPGIENVMSAFLESSEERDAEVEEKGKPKYESFIHLRNARYWSEAGSLPGAAGRGVHWRGRIAEVDGWNLGVPGIPSEG